MAAYFGGVSVFSPPSPERVNERLTEPEDEARDQPLDGGLSRWRHDLAGAVALTSLIVLLGAPAGLLWSAVAPHFTIVRTDGELSLPNIESSKAFVGADGSYVVVVVALGVLTGALAWRWARSYGPGTVLGLTVGGLLAALVAAAVGLRPGAQEAVEALRDMSGGNGSFELFLGARDQATGDLSLRAAWAPVLWPVASLVTFLVPAFRRSDL